VVEQINLRKNMEFNKKHKLEWPKGYSFFVLDNARTQDRGTEILSIGFAGF